jgi:2-dehydropantoate 2-reductase
VLLRRKKGRERLRILIIGAGAVGGYYGGRLLEYGRDVTFLVRPRRREQLAATGLVVKSPYGDISLPAPTVLASEIGDSQGLTWDLIIVSCKAYDLAGAMDGFAPAVGPNTMILPLLNGMRHLDALAARFGQKRVLGGLCSIGVMLDAQGAIVHFNNLHDLSFGEIAGGESARTRAVADLSASTRMQWSLSSDVIQAMWEKWVVLSTLAGATCLLRANTGDIVSVGGAETIGAFLNEAQSIAEAEGHAVAPDKLEGMLQLLTDPASTFNASMLRDMERGGPVEADHVIGDLLKRGEAAGLSTPLMQMAFLHLRAYEARRAREQGIPKGQKNA